MYQLKNVDGKSINLFLYGSLENCRKFLDYNRDLSGCTLHYFYLRKPYNQRILNITKLFKTIKKIDYQWHIKILSRLKYKHSLAQEFYTLSIDNNEFMELVEHW